MRTDRRDRAFGLCPVCSREVEILTLDQAISLSGIRTGRLVRLTESGNVHAIETTFGHLLICRESLSALDIPQLERGNNESIEESEIV
jgi:hypothetical protein